jgi:YD repeat-containing protein
LLSYTDENGTVTRAMYDQARRVTDTYRTFNGKTEAQLTHIGYESTTGFESALTEYASSTAQTVTFNYEDAGRLLKTNRPNAVVTTNTYATSGTSGPGTNTIEANFTRANQTGWGTSTNSDGVANLAWGMKGDGTQSFVTVSGNTGQYGYPGGIDQIGIASSGNTTYNAGDSLAEFSVSAVGHVAPYVVQNACSDSSCFYGARVKTSASTLEIDKKVSSGSTTPLTSVAFAPTPARSIGCVWTSPSVAPKTSSRRRSGQTAPLNLIGWSARQMPARWRRT